MNALRMRAGWFLVLIAVLLVAACGGGSAEEPAAEATQPPATQAPAATDTTAPTEASAPTEAPTQAPTQAEEQATPTETVAETAPETEIPLDVPIMEGAEELLVQESVGSVTYVMNDTEIEQVVEFYQTELTARGWEARTTSAIGMMATLVYEKEGNRVSVSLQANTFAKTVNVRLFIHEG
jgi:glucose/arabinose dehydrogenase